MKLLWDGQGPLGNPPKTYKTYGNAVKAAELILAGDYNQKVIIAATPEGRFFPVALGEKALQNGLHFHMCVAA